MKKKIVGIAMAATLLMGIATTAFAAGNPAGGNTDVYVGVTTTTPENISITVPTALAIAVVSDQTAQTVTTLMGNYMVNADGSVTTSGDAVQGIKEQRVTFVNNGAVAAQVSGARIVNSYSSKWTISDAAASPYNLSLSLNDVKAGTIAPDNNSTITLNNFALPANQVTHMKAEVKAGGAYTDYTDVKESAKSFVIEWNIKAQ